MRKQKPLRPYFEKMPAIGHLLTDAEKQRWQENAQKIRNYEQFMAQEAEKIKSVGTPMERIHKKGQMTAYERIEYLVDAETWCPLHTFYNPADNEYGCTGVIDGLAKIEGHWAVVIAFDNKILAGAWIAGQAENILRVTDLAKKLNIPLVWVLNCSGVKLTEQEKVYAGPRGNGATFFRHAELNQLGIPVLNAIFGTNPAGGGYHGISPTILIAHNEANIAVGGAGIVGGMNPTGHFDMESALQIIEATKSSRAKPPGGVETHFDKTAFFREVHDTETGVLDGIKEYMKGLPVYHPDYFKVTDEADPAFSQEELYYLLQADHKMIYDSIQVLARMVDSSEFMEYRPDYGPEIFAGIAKIDGFPVGIIGNKQGFILNYPNYGEENNIGLGGKLYRQGLIKMNEFVTFCGRDNLPIIWLQDTLGIDVGDNAEKAELLGLGQSLIYSIEKSAMPMLCIILREGTAAAHYVMGGPQSTTTAMTIGTAITEIYVMNSGTAAIANYGRRLVKDQKQGKSLDETLGKMNAMVDDYYNKSRPNFCAQAGMVDEIVPMDNLRKYCIAFTDAYYQNPRSITPVHQMILPRIIKG